MKADLEPTKAIAWASRWLVAAGLYNLLWGALTIGFPHVLFDLARIERTNYPEIWQCVGMIVGVYGIGYLIAASDPRNHWPIVLVGLLGKVFGPIGFVAALLRGTFPPLFGLTILTNDLVWWIPFGMILWDAAKHRSDDRRPAPAMCSQFVKESRINASPEVVFRFHESPDALRQLIPPWENMKVAASADSLLPGSQVELRGRLGLLPIRWVAVHTEYDPPHLFADRQESGPFAWWYHRHRFLDDGEGGTVLRDEVEYQAPLGLIGSWLGGWLIRRKLERMFAFRHETTRRLIESSERTESSRTDRLRDRNKVTHDVVIVGGGLAGLCCALHLQQRGANFLLLEASDGVGGRIRTDLVAGFRLDRGFQVFLTSYPEAKQRLDYEALQLRPFLPGALVRQGAQFHLLTDPWRRPFAAMRSLVSPIGSFADKWRVARLRSRSLHGSFEDRFRDPEITTLQALKDAGFSTSMIDRFFRPFLGGVFLDPDLRTSSRMLHFVFRMFSLGSACLPAAGMEAIPQQLASALPPSTIRLDACVVRVQSGGVSLESGEQLNARAVVVAVDGEVAARLLGDTISSAGQGVTCLYFAARRPPIDQPILVLNGEGRGPINNLCVPTLVAPSYAPGDASLVSATVLGITEDAERLLAAVREQLGDWFGSAVRDWQHLRSYRIPYALPQQVPPALRVPERPVRWQPGVYVCGDHRDNASIQGAMVSGRRAAEAVLEDLS